MIIMNTVFLMFDSLNRDKLSVYGCQEVWTPNFKRFEEKSVTFDNCFAGSLPCIPARRELHTGRSNFLHRSWGPLEPFDDSMPEMLKNNGVLSHLISDHCHYWEDGGCTYHTRFDSWEFIRGQEGDPWKVTPELFHNQKYVANTDGKYFPRTGKFHRQDKINRSFIRDEEDYPLAKTFREGLSFIEDNHREGPWFLQLECFDPHEPFDVYKTYREMYPEDFEGDYDWPPYHYIMEDKKTAHHLKTQYEALVTMCDAYLGKLLDLFDKYNLWKNTALIIGTDHGYLLGEHGWWSKTIMPVYDEIAHIPLMIYLPEYSALGGTHRKSLVQTVDIPVTVLDIYGLSPTDDMAGKSLKSVIERDAQIRDYVMFGFHGAHVNIFDGHYLYMRAPVSQSNQPLFDYTLMPTHMRDRFSKDDLSKSTLTNGFSFTKGCPVLKVPCGNKANDDSFAELLKDPSCPKAMSIDNNNLVNAANFGTKLFDMMKDPDQLFELNDPIIEARMANLLVRAMKEADSPEEQFERVGLPKDRKILPEDILRLRLLEDQQYIPQILEECKWQRSGVNAFSMLMRFIEPSQRDEVKAHIEDQLKDCALISDEVIVRCIPQIVEPESFDMVIYFVGLAGRSK